MRKITLALAMVGLLLFTGCGNDTIDQSANDLQKDKPTTTKKKVVKKSKVTKVKKRVAHEPKKVVKKDSESKLDTIASNVSETDTNSQDNSVVDDTENQTTNTVQADDTENTSFQVINFAFDSFKLTEDMLVKERMNYGIISNLYQDKKIKLEGNCDEWGTDEYNYALGLKRAKAVKEVLVSFGMDANRIELLSYGESNPICTEKTNSCWKKNRRVNHIVLP